MKIKSQSGSVLVYILIAVALFGALSFVVAQMMRSGSGDQIGEQKASLLADEIMAYGQVLRRSIQPLRISNGCEESDISFEMPLLTGYANGSNVKCQLFNNAGGGATYVKPSLEYGDGSDWVFTGSNVASGVGSAEPDLVAILPNISLQVCKSINSKLKIGTLANDGAIDFTKFQGNFASTQTIDPANGLLTGCHNYNASGDHYFYYQVLISR